LTERFACNCLCTGACMITFHACMHGGRLLSVEVLYAIIRETEIMAFSEFEDTHLMRFS
jgi:hypothetical protein